MLHKILIILYYAANLAILAGLSIYDYKHLKLQKTLYYVYMPISLLSVYVNLVLNNFDIKYVLTTGLVAAGVVYAVFFAIALLTHNQLGGGDVKLIPFIGFAFGPYIQTVLLVMSAALLLLVIAAGIYNLSAKARGVPKEEYKKAKINGPHPAIPYMFVGCLVTAVIQTVKYFKI